MASNGRQKRRLTNFNVENHTAVNRPDVKSIVYIILEWVASTLGARVGGECDPLREIHANVETNREAYCGRFKKPEVDLFEGDFVFTLGHPRICLTHCGSTYRKNWLAAWVSDLVLLQILLFCLLCYRALR